MEKEKQLSALRERIRAGLKAADKILREMPTEEREYMPCSEWDIIEEQVMTSLAVPQSERPHVDALSDMGSDGEYTREAAAAIKPAPPASRDRDDSCPCCNRMKCICKAKPAPACEAPQAKLKHSFSLIQAACPCCYAPDDIHLQIKAHCSLCERERGDK